MSGWAPQLHCVSVARTDVSGAQPAAILLGALQQAWAKGEPLTLLPPASADAAGACIHGACDEAHRH